MPYRFIIFTWLLIIPIHTLLTCLALAIVEWKGGALFDIHSIIRFDQLASIAIFSVPFSLPGLFGLMVLVWIAKGFIYDYRTGFSFIAIGCIFVTLCCYFFLEIMLNLDIKLDEYIPLASGTVISVVVSLLFTRKYFYSYFKAHT